LGSTLQVKCHATNGTGTSATTSDSAATSALADIDLSADAPVLSRTSASGATPYTVDAVLGSKTYTGYHIQRQIATTNGFATLLYDGTILITEAMLQAPNTIDWTTASPAYSEPADSQFWERQRIIALSPSGVSYYSSWSNVISKTDAVAPVVWNASDKTAGMTLTNGSLTGADSSGHPDSVRASRGASSGKVYWELRIDASGGNMRIGVADSSASLTAFWSDGIHDAAYDKNGPLAYNGTSNNYATFTTGDTIQFALDATAKKLWVGKNNTWQNGDPAAGTSGQAMASISTPILPAYQGEFGSQATAHFTTGSFTYTPPSGFAAL
jgi:hypothetical protein